MEPWNPDLILWLNNSAIRVLGERLMRLTVLLHLSVMTGSRTQPRARNRSAPAGHETAAVYDATTRTFAILPEQVRRSLT